MQPGRGAFVMALALLHVVLLVPALFNPAAGAGSGGGVLDEVAVVLFGATGGAAACQHAHNLAQCVRSNAPALNAGERAFVATHGNSSDCSCCGHTTLLEVKWWKRTRLHFRPCRSVRRRYVFGSPLASPPSVGLPMPFNAVVSRLLALHPLLRGVAWGFANPCQASITFDALISSAACLTFMAAARAPPGKVPGKVPGKAAPLGLSGPSGLAFVLLAPLVTPAGAFALFLAASAARRVSGRSATQDQAGGQAGGKKE